MLADALPPFVSDWLPSGFDLRSQAVQIAAAIAISWILLVVSWAFARWIGKPLRARMRPDAGKPPEPLVERIEPMIRRALAIMLLSLAVGGWPWDSLALLVFGLALGLAASRLLYDVLRLVHLPRPAAPLIAVLAFAATVSLTLGGLDSVGEVLERIGIDLGRGRISVRDVVVFAATGLALYAIVRLAIRFAALSIGRAGTLDATQKLLAQKLASIAVVIIAFFVGIDLLGIDLTAFAVFSGAMGLAVGFGLQKTVGNLIAGIILLMDRSIKPGDVVVVGDSFGMVNKIGVRAVSVITRDGKEHLIPNEILMTTEVENWSYTDRNVRIRIPVVLPHEADIDLAQRLMLEACDDCPRVLRSPQPTVWMTEIQDSGALHEIRVWISDPESGLGPVKNDVLKRMLTLFRDNGLQIALPRRDIRIQRATLDAPDRRG